MNINRAIELLKIEVACIKRAENCDRVCDRCDLVQDTEELLEAYRIAINKLQEQVYKATI